jgi:hypothetical protein
MTCCECMVGTPPSSGGETLWGSVGGLVKEARLMGQTSVGGGIGKDVEDDFSGSGKMTSVAADMDGKMTSRAASPLLLEALASHLSSHAGSSEPTYSTLLPLAAHAAQPRLASAVDQPIIDRTVSPRPLPAMVDAADHTIVDQTIETGP